MIVPAIAILVWWWLGATAAIALLRDARREDQDLDLYLYVYAIILVALGALGVIFAVVTGTYRFQVGREHHVGHGRFSRWIDRTKS